MARERRVQGGLLAFYRRIARLIANPVFIALTLFGNFVVAAGACGLFFLERGINPSVESLLDTVWWAVSTVSTVGYGDVIPITPWGRVVGIALMIVGTALFWSYTALFAEALLTEDIVDVEAELRSINRRLREMRLHEASNAREVDEQMRALVRSLEARLEERKLSQ